MSDTGQKISWIVPVISKDLPYLPGLLSACARQTHPIFEVVLVGSGLRRAERKAMLDLVSSHVAPVRIILRLMLHSAGSNRNRGIKAASGDWVSFFDADDIPADSRNSVISSTISDLSNPDDWVLMHSFEVRSREDLEACGSFGSVMGQSNSPKMLNELTSDRVARLRALRTIERGRLLRGKKYVLMRFKGTTSNGPHHAAITLKRVTALRVRFPSRPLKRDEDVAFVNQLWLNGLKFGYIDDTLMIYRQGLSHGPVEELKLVNPFWRLEMLRRKAEAFSRWTRRKYRRVLRTLVLLMGQAFGGRRGPA